MRKKYLPGCRVNYLGFKGRTGVEPVLQAPGALPKICVYRMKPDFQLCQQLCQRHIMSPPDYRVVGARLDDIDVRVLNAMQFCAFSICLWFLLPCRKSHATKKSTCCSTSKGDKSVRGRRVSVSSCAVVAYCACRREFCCSLVPKNSAGRQNWSASPCFG